MVLEGESICDFSLAVGGPSKRQVGHSGASQRQHQKSDASAAGQAH